MALKFKFNALTGQFDLVDVTNTSGFVTSVTASAPLSSSGGTTPNLTITQAGAASNGFLSSIDWNTFNNKQSAGNYITALTGDISASGPGSATATLATVNSNVGSFGSASNVGTFTVNAKGLITAASDTAIQIAESQVTNLVNDLAGKQPTGNYITALTGDGTASGPGSVAFTLATVNSDIGTFNNLTVNAKGLVTAASNVAYLTGNQTITLSGDVTGSGATAITTNVGAINGVAYNADPLTQYALLAGRSGGQTLIGGSGVTDSLILKATTGNATSTAIAFQLLGGNNGATVLTTILNNIKFGIGTATPGDISSGITLAGSVFHLFSSNNFSRFVVDGNSGAVLDMLNGGGAVNQKHYQMVWDDDTVTLRVLNDSGSLRNNLMTINGTGGIDMYSTTGSVFTLRRVDTSVTANDMVGKIQFYAADTSTTTNFIVADIEAQATNTISTDINPGRLIFRTTDTGVASTPTERMRITEVGQLKLAGTAVRGTTEGTNHLDIFNGTAPVGTLTNGVSVYSDGGQAKVMDSVGTATLLSSLKANGRSTAQTAAVASVATYTVGAADASFMVSANVLVTTATTHNFTVTCAYTDEGNTARTLTLTFGLVAGGVAVTAIANANGAVPYMGVPLHIRCKASTAITIATTGTFTTVTYNVEGIIRQIA